MTELPAWAVAVGVPSLHMIAAAVQVAGLIDHGGSEAADLRRSYAQHASGAYFPEPDLITAEGLLIDVGLLRRLGTRLIPTPELSAITSHDTDDARVDLIAHVLATFPAPAAPSDLSDVLYALLPDASRREELLLALEAKFDDTRRNLVGHAGEVIVFRQAVQELEALGYQDFAAKVHHVSLRSDALGYDISAPRTIGNARLLEVKAFTEFARDGFIRVFLSRNEADVGEQFDQDWFIVFCKVDDVEMPAGEVLGWCARHQLDSLLPTDTSSGTWASAELLIDANSLSPGLPRIG